MQQSLITARWSTRPAFTVCRTSSSRQRPGLCCLKGRRSLRGFYRRATTGAPRTLDDQLAVPDLTRRRIDHSRVMVAFPIPMPAILPTGGSAMPANDSCQQACDPRGRLGHHQADDRPPRTPNLSSPGVAILSFFARSQSGELDRTRTAKAPPHRCIRSLGYCLTVDGPNP